MPHINTNTTIENARTNAVDPFALSSTPVQSSSQAPQEDGTVPVGAHGAAGAPGVGGQVQIGDVPQVNATGDASAGVQAEPTVLYLNGIPGKGQRVFTSERAHRRWGSFFQDSLLRTEEEVVQRFEGKVDVVVGRWRCDVAPALALKPKAILLFGRQTGSFQLNWDTLKDSDAQTLREKGYKWKWKWLDAQDYGIALSGSSWFMGKVPCFVATLPSCRFTLPAPTQRITVSVAVEREPIPPRGTQESKGVWVGGRRIRIEELLEWKGRICAKDMGDHIVCQILGWKHFYFRRDNKFYRFSFAELMRVMGWPDDFHSEYPWLGKLGCSEREDFILNTPPPKLVEALLGGLQMGAAEDEAVMADSDEEDSDEEDSDEEEKSDEGEEGGAEMEEEAVMAESGGAEEEEAAPEVAEEAAGEEVVMAEEAAPEVAESGGAEAVMAESGAEEAASRSSPSPNRAGGQADISPRTGVRGSGEPPSPFSVMDGGSDAEDGGEGGGADLNPERASNLAPTEVEEEPQDVEEAAEEEEAADVGTADDARPLASADDIQNTHWLMYDEPNFVGRSAYNSAEWIVENASDHFKTWLLNLAMKSPLVLLPIDPGCLQKLQAIPNPQAPREFMWKGLLPRGGVKPVLPAAYIDKCFSRDLIRDCKSKAGVPVDCTRVGNALSASSSRVEDRASERTIAVVFGPHKIQFPQGDKDYCVAYSTASAVHFAGDEAAARTIAALAVQSIKERKPVVYVQTQSLERLKPAWEVRKLKNAASVDWQSLADLPGVTVVQLKDSTGNLQHCVAIASGWIFDTNKKHAVKLSQAGLDACCLGEATFAGFQSGFRLLRPEASGSSKRGRDGEACGPSKVARM